MFEDSDEDLIGSEGSPLPVRAMTMVMAALAVLALLAVAAEVIWLKPRHDDLEQQLADRSAVIAATQRFVVTSNTYTPDTFEAMTQQVREMLSTKLRTSFDEQNKDLVNVVKQAELSSTGSVLKTGVASLDNDSAVVLVVADADASSKGQDTTRHFRWEVDLVKVKGDWLVDDFNAVTDPTLGATQ